MAYEASLDEMMFFDGKPEAMELYRAFAEKLFCLFPDTGMRVQKSQITFTAPKVFACVSMAKVRPARQRPKEYITITFGLGAQMLSPRIDVATEAYPGRWTHHVLVSRLEEIDDELMDWVGRAYHFARVK